MERQYNHILNKIANTLYINSQHTESNGLLKGKMGITIFFYQYGRYTSIPIYTDFANEFLDYLLERMAKNTVLNFADGISGMAWGIDYLIKNKYVDSDDDFLNDVDVLVSHITTSDFSKELDYQLPLFGKGLYAIQRNKRELITQAVYQLEEFVYHQKILPESYVGSLRYFLTKAIEMDIEGERCLHIMNMLPIAAMKDVKDITSFYNHCWEYFLYATPQQEINKVLPDNQQLKLFIDQAVDNMNNQAISLYKGLAGLGTLLIHR